jgi:hypothetical protein
MADEPTGTRTERLRTFTEDTLMVIEFLVVLLIGVGLSLFFVYEVWWVIFSGVGRQPRLTSALELISKNWKAGLLLLVPLFYRTVRTFLERVEEAWGMKARSPQAMETKQNPPIPSELP